MIIYSSSDSFIASFTHFVLLTQVAVMAGVNLPGESGLTGLTSEEYSTTTNDENDGEDEETNKDDDAAADIHDFSGKNDFKIDAAMMELQQKQGQQNARNRNKIQGKTRKQVRGLQKLTGDTSLTHFPGGQELNEVILVGGSTRIPAVQKLITVLTGVPPTRTVNPDEAVSLGAAVMAGIMDGDIADMQVMSAWQAAIVRTMYDQKDKFETTFLTQRNTSIADTVAPDVINGSKKAGSVSNAANITTKKSIVTPNPKKIRISSLRRPPSS